MSTSQVEEEPCREMKHKTRELRFVRPYSVRIAVLTVGVKLDDRLFDAWR